MYNVYSYRKKRPYGLIITLVIVSIITVVSGYFAYKMLTKPIEFKKAKAPAGEVSNTTLPDVPKTANIYSGDGEFNLSVFYSCGHNTNFISNMPDNFLGKTIEQIKEENPDYDIYDYTNNIIYANHFISELCDHHYIIALNGSRLISYNKKTPDVIEKEITVNLRELFSEDIEILKRGIEVSSKNELLEYFEGFAS